MNDNPEGLTTQQWNDQHPQFSSARGNRAMASARAQALHEQMFGERTQMDLEKLSLAQQRLMVDKSRALEAATLSRAKIGMQLRRNVSAAAAIERMGLLEPNDPKFLQKLSSIAAQYPDALGSTAFQKIMEDRRSDHKLFQDAAAVRTAATFNNPAVADSYQKALAGTNDPKFAAAAAKATEELYGKAKALASNPDLSAQDKAQIYDPTKGTFNLDPTAITKLEVQAATVKAQRDTTTGANTSAKAAADALKALGPANNDPEKDGGDTQAIKDARYNLQQHLKDTSFAGAAPAAPPPTAPKSKVDAYLEKFLGAAPAAPAAVATPAVTPEQAAAEPAAPPAAPPGSDNADPEDILNEPTVEE